MSATLKLILFDFVLRHHRLLIRHDETRRNQND